MADQNNQNKKKMSWEEIVDAMIKNKRLRLSIVKKSHKCFFQYYFSPNNTEYQSAKFHEDIFQITQDKDIRMTVVLGFRGCGKSTLMSQSLPIWAILGEQKIKYVLIISETQAKSQMLLKILKNIFETNEKLKKDLGPFSEEHNGWNITSLYLPKYQAKITAVSKEQSIRSFRHIQHRPQLIICDDLENDESVKTLDGRDKVYNWLVGDVIPAGTKDTRIIVVGSLLHNDCLIRRLQTEIKERKRDGVSLEIPFSNEKGIPAWKSKFPNEESVISEKKRIGNERIWMREYMLQVMPDLDQIFLPEWFEKYKYEMMPSFDSPDYKGTYIGVDPAVSQKEDRDKSGIVIASVFGSGKDMRIYVHPHTVNQRYRFHDLTNEIIYLAKNVGARNRTMPIIENVAAQKWLYEELRQRGIRAELFEVHGIEKAERLKIATLPVEAGMVFFPTHGIEELKIQLSGFGVERFDDLADAFSIVINKIMEGRDTGESNFFTGDNRKSFVEFKRNNYLTATDPQQKGAIDITKQMAPPWKDEDEWRKLAEEDDKKKHREQINDADGLDDDDRKIVPRFSWFS